MARHESITQERVLEMAEIAESTLDNPGICEACGEDACGCEPDAKNYECESCGEYKVHGWMAYVIGM